MAPQSSAALLTRENRLLGVFFVSRRLGFKSFQELVDGVGQIIEALCEAFFHLLQAFVHGSKDPDFVCNEPFLHSFVLGREALLLKKGL
jgi:hypothetical protein